MPFEFSINLSFIYGSLYMFDLTITISAGAFNNLARSINKLSAGCTYVLPSCHFLGICAKHLIAILFFLIQVIGSSLLFVHDNCNANVWLIDFAKTILLPEEITIDHSSKWKVGNHEDGYLIGINNLISIFLTMLENQPVTITPPLTLSDPLDGEREEEEANAT